MQETKRIGLELWIGLWAIAGLTALCLAMVGAGWHHLLIALVAFALAYAPVRIDAEIRRRRPASGQAPEAAATPLAIVADASDDDEVTSDVESASDDEAGPSRPRRDVDQVA